MREEAECTRNVQECSAIQAVGIHVYIKKQKTGLRIKTGSQML